MTEATEKTENKDPDYDELSEPQSVDVPDDHPLWPTMRACLKEIYDPEIPVNIYELGLIYAITAVDRKDDSGKTDLDVKMTLTSPGCPVAQEMPGWVQGALMPIDGVGDVDVEIIWEPQWTPAIMSEAAIMQLNMFM
jgi:FeS assembly SUF system protein